MIVEVCIGGMVGAVRAKVAEWVDTLTLPAYYADNSQEVEHGGAQEEGEHTTNYYDPCEC